MGATIKANSSSAHQDTLLTSNAELDRLRAEAAGEVTTLRERLDEMMQ